MNTYAEQSEKGQNRASANHSSTDQGHFQSSARYADHRSESTLQRKLQELAGQSRQATETVQRQAADEDELLQGKFESGQSRQATETVQRQAADEDELLQGKFESGQSRQATETVQRQAADEDELLQGKFESGQSWRATETVQRQAEGECEDESEDAMLQCKSETVQKEKNNTGLPDKLKSGVERLSGLSIDDVKVHYNSAKPAQLQAHAYTQGTEIHVAPGQEKHLAHEAWHVVQQKQGRVQPTMQLKDGVHVNDDASLESEAEAMGGQAMIEGDHII